VFGNRVFVVDSGNARVQEFTLDGEFVRAWGAAGQQPGGFVTAAYITMGPNGMLNVGDPGAGRIQQFSATGAYLGGWGLPAGEDAFEPQGLAFRQDGSVLVADLRRAQVLLFEPTD
jgi:DNA-binding beta-propeller fold protein YncE